jgi:ankyrin repeat protein
MASNELTPLMQACQNGDTEEIKRLFEKSGAKIVADLDANNRTALHYCAENVNTKCAELLIQQCNNKQQQKVPSAIELINQQDKEGYSCLHLCVINGNLKLAEYLIQKGANINLNDSEQHSHIHWAVVCAQPEILDLLLSSNADPETSDVHGAYPIHYAAQMCGHVDMWCEDIVRDQTKSFIVLKKLIKHHVKLDVEDSDQRNAIIWAASSGKLIQFLYNENYYLL